MLGKSIASGRLKLQVKQQKKLLPSRKRQQQMNRGSSISASSSRLSSGARSSTVTSASGFSSSLTFTPIQGIELCNPDAAASSSGASASTAKSGRILDSHRGTRGEGKTDYFSSSGKFIKVEKDRASVVPKAV